MGQFKFVFKPQLLVLGFIILCFFSCNEEKQEPIPNDLKNDPKIKTFEITNVKSASATGGGVVLDEAGNTVLDKGICWSIKSTPTINDDKVSAGAGDGEFNVQIEKLSRNTQYFVRSFLINKNDVYYGNEVAFSTLVYPALPFDSFWFVNRFADQTASNNNFLNTWAESKPYQAVVDDKYYYYASVYGNGALPSGCTKTYTKKDGILTIKFDCSIPKFGKESPNAAEWLESLKFKIDIVVNLDTRIPISAFIDFPDYGEKIDFKNILTVTYTANIPSLGNRLITGVKSTQLTRNNGSKLLATIVIDEYL
jgi:hypothetical protein